MKTEPMTLRDAARRAITAIEHRIHMTETVMIPQAKERRNMGIVEVLESGLTNDREALRILHAAYPQEDLP